LKPIIPWPLPRTGTPVVSPEMCGRPITRIQWPGTRQRRVEFFGKALCFVCYSILRPVRSLCYSKHVRFSFAKPPRSKIFLYQEDEIPISWQFCILPPACTFAKKTPTASPPMRVLIPIPLLSLSSFSFLHRMLAPPHHPQPPARPPKPWRRRPSPARWLLSRSAYKFC
jgi:hypothetical protein